MYLHKMPLLQGVSWFSRNLPNLLVCVAALCVVLPFLTYRLSFLCSLFEVCPIPRNQCTLTVLYKSNSNLANNTHYAHFGLFTLYSESFEYIHVYLMLEKYLSLQNFVLIIFHRICCIVPSLDPEWWGSSPGFVPPSHEAVFPILWFLSFCPPTAELSPHVQEHCIPNNLTYIRQMWIFSLNLIWQWSWVITSASFKEVQ